MHKNLQMAKPHYGKFMAMFFLVALLTACGGRDDNSTTAAGTLVPASLNGKSYKLLITSGSGNFATTGSAQLTFGPTNYAIDGDDVNVADTQGTYRTSKTGNNTIEITINDSVLGKVVYIFTYSSATNGTFSASLGGSGQTGSFSE